METLKNTFKVKETFKDRTIGFWIGLAASGLFLISTIIFIILYSGDNVFFHPDERDRVRIAWVCTFFFIGVIFQGVAIITDLKFAQMIPVVFYSIGIGLYLYLAMFPIADFLMGVEFFGGTLPSVIAFAVIFLLGAVAAVISCFLNQRKTEN